jgi:GDP-L-fucose synthase
MEHYAAAEPINLGGGVDLSIRELAEQIKTVVGYDGELRFDTSKPDGMPLKSLDSRRLAALGRLPMTPIDAALNRTYRWFVEHSADQERVLCGVEG